MKIRIAVTLVVLGLLTIRMLYEYVLNTMNLYCHQPISVFADCHASLKLAENSADILIVRSSLFLAPKSQFCTVNHQLAIIVNELFYNLLELLGGVAH